MNNGLSANAVWFKAIDVPDQTPATLVLNDKGKKAAGVEVSDRVNRGEQVLAVDLLFTGDAWRETDPADFQQILHGLGDRGLGLETAQLIEIAQWLKSRSGSGNVRLESRGFRNQVAALIASALEPDLFSEIVIREGMASLNHLLEKPVKYQEAADLFCLDLYKEIDLDRLEIMAAPTKFVHRD